MAEQNQEMEDINKNPNFSFCRENVLGCGRDSNVFSGRFNGQRVAVKRILKNNINGDSELNNLRKLQEHPQQHIVKLLHDEVNKDFRFIALELCDENLREYVSHPRPVLTDKSAQLNILVQLTDALKYIHSKNIIHCDIKPENVLVSCKYSSCWSKIFLSVIMKWADFGHSKCTDDRDYALTSGSRGTENWRAPEIIGPESRQCSRESDIFSAGCVFFFFLTEGVHPFGEKGLENFEQNIIDGTMKNENKLNNRHPAKSTVIKMMENLVVNRLKVDEVIEELKKATPVSIFVYFGCCSCVCIISVVISVVICWYH